jgi:hypothetical protein
MSDAERRIVEDRRTRKDAHANFAAGLTQIKADLDARSVPGRIADKARQDATDAMATGLEIASESKGIIAAVLAGIGLWIFRAPLLRQLSALLQRDDPATVQADDDSAADEG